MKRQNLINISINIIDRSSSKYNLDEDRKQDLYLKVLERIAKWSDDYIKKSYITCYQTLYQMIKKSMNTTISDNDRDEISLSDMRNSNLSYDTLLHDVLNIDKDEKIQQVLLDVLKPREYIVIMMYFGINGLGHRSLREIGETEFSPYLTRGGCRYILEKGLRRLRHPVHIRRLIDYYVF